MKEIIEQVNAWCETHMGKIVRFAVAMILSLYFSLFGFGFSVVVPFIVALIVEVGASVLRYQESGEIKFDAMSFYASILGLVVTAIPLCVHMM